MQLDEQSLPVTRAQLDIWLAHDVAGSGTEWLLGLFVKIAGALDRDALEWAINRVVREAEPVRASFFEVDGQVYQKAVDHPDVELAFYDLRSASDPVAEARDMAAAIQRAPMAFTEPLFRFALFQTRDDEHFLIACCHHIVLDGTGIALVGSRLASVYSAVFSGAPIPPPIFGSLADLIDNESKYEASGEYLEDQAYWTGNLPPEAGPNSWQTESVDRDEQHSHSTSVQFDSELLRQVDILARSKNVARSSVITAACALLVRGWSPEGSDVVLDFPVSRRVSPESRTLPGMVAGVVPLRVKASPATSISQFIDDVDGHIQEALQHQRYPVHALERKLNPRSAGQMANRVSVNFLPSTFTLDFGGAEASASLTNVGVVGGFGLVFSSAGDELILSTMGTGQPFSSFDVTDLAERLQRILAAFVSDPALRLSAVDVLDAADCARLDAVGHRGVLARPVVELSVPAAFAAQVARAPEAVAVSFDGRGLSYRELDEASNRLAHELIGQGAGPGECVALMLERSAQAVVAILAVLKSGAAYLPIDPAHPDARVEFMLADAQPVAAVTVAGRGERFHGSGVPVIAVDDPRIEGQSVAALPLPAPDDVAHIIY
ncbi:condensation domain-containing protein, partial [Mycolicibacterium peregrinum]|uniref:condensation domain-containing protein n=1 Tax=Mycolicibacterium peregrinum TaxID=43304 RepID=UPI000A83DA37